MSVVGALFVLAAVTLAYLGATSDSLASWIFCGFFGVVYGAMGVDLIAFQWRLRRLRRESPSSGRPS